MAELAAKGLNPSVVADQYGRLTFTSTLAEGVVHLLTHPVPYGTYNLTNGGPSIWYEIARTSSDWSGREPSDVTATTTREYGSGKQLAPR